MSINMEPFVRKVQPSRVEAWKEGRDFALHPEDPWYVRRCLQDAIARLLREEISMSEFEKVKRELRGGRGKFRFGSRSGLTLTMTIRLR